MKSIARASLFALFGLLVACGGNGSDPSPDGSVDGSAPSGDQDGDTISDADEGRGQGERGEDVNTDGADKPDYRDEDSDNDGIPDSVEAGDADLSTPPRDSDDDGTPDFRDLDSDDNGIPDSEELDEDTDGDGILDAHDLDDDDDAVSDVAELQGTTDPPLDSDNDGIPNFKDPDSDNDLILDGDEGAPDTDTDEDGLPDWTDNDSDDDGIPDREEAGDEDLYSPPINSDADTGDMIPDFRDPDSDNDGLADNLERENGTSPTEADTDGDGVSDLIEVSAGTDPLDAEENPRTRGDFVFVVPHMETPMPERDTLEFRTNLQFADIYFMFDQSGSMSTEIGALQSAVGSLVGDLTCADSGVSCTRDSACAGGEICSNFSNTCIEDPTASSCLLSAWTGVGKYEVEYENLLSLQPDPSATGFALGFSTSGGTENLFGAVWGVVDPEASPSTTISCAMPMMGRLGCPGFREEAVRILVTFTDEDSDDSVAPADVGSALQAADTTFIGVWTGTAGNSARQDLVDIATESGSLDGSGDPLVFDGADAAVVGAVEDAIREIVEGVPIRVTIEPTDEPGDDGDALQFLDYLEVNTSGGRCTAVTSTEDTDGDMHDDAFTAVLPGTPVCWDVVPKRNDTVEPTTQPQVYRARLTVKGDGSPLDARTIYFLVPPDIPCVGEFCPEE